MASLSKCGETIDNDWIDNSDDSVKDPDYEISSESDCLSEAPEDFIADDPVVAARAHSPPVEDQGVTKSRKRQRKPSKREIAKRLRNTGKAYVNVKGAMVENKSFRNTDCGCAKKCIESVTEDERKLLFKIFYEMADFSRQNAYLCGLIHQTEVNLHVEWCRSNNYEPVKEYFYRHIFNTKFHLHFHVPRQDTCKSCDKYKQLKDVEENETLKRELEIEHELHLRKAERVRASLKKDGEDAKENPEIYTITIDLQKALPFPKLSVSEAYYKRNMYCYNLGVHDVANNIGYMYVWDETMASRGSQEVAACIKKHISVVNKKHVVIYSDACTGQNRNIKLALTLMKITQESTSVDKIDHKFMASGHSYLPNDSDFGLVEKESRGKTIFVPDDWYSIIKNARRSKKFMLVQMQQEDFLSTDLVEKAITKRKNKSGAAVNWLAIQWLRYEKEKPFTIFYKETLNEDIQFNEIDIRPTKEVRPRLLKNVEQAPMYSGPRNLNHLKKRDMLSLLKYIPPIHHNFFENIRTSANFVDAGPLTDGEDDVDQ